MHREHGFDHVSLRTVVSLRLLVAPAALADAQKEHRTKAQVLTRPPVGAWSTARRAASAGIRRGLLESRVSLIGGKRPVLYRLGRLRCKSSPIACSSARNKTWSGSGTNPSPARPLHPVQPAIRTNWVPTNKSATLTANQP
jgi:hypothetical protein